MHLSYENELILFGIDQITEDDKQKIFPNYNEFINSNPNSIIPLILDGIGNDKLIDDKKIRNKKYNRLENMGFGIRLH